MILANIANSTDGTPQLLAKHSKTRRNKILFYFV